MSAGRVLKTIVIPGFVCGLAAAGLFGLDAVLLGYGDFRLFLSYLAAFGLVFTVSSFLLHIYAAIVRIPASPGRQFYLMAVSLLSAIILLAVSHAVNSVLGKHQDFTSFPRNLAFLPAGAFFFGFSKITRKLPRLALGTLTAVLVGLWAFLSWGTWEGISGTSRKSGGSPNILLLTAESLRYDHLGVTSGGRVNTPTLDRLIREGLFFENYFVQAPYTTASLSALMTGRYPFKNGARAFGEKPDDRNPPFFMKLAPLDYSFRVDAFFFRELFLSGTDPNGLGKSVPGPAERLLSSWDTVNSYLGWILPRFFGRYCLDGSTSMYQSSSLMRAMRRTRSNPWFFWTHFSANCHWPYESPSEFGRLYPVNGKSEPRPITEEEVLALNARPDLLRGEVLDEIEAAYSAEVSCLDRQISYILNQLRKLGILEETVIIFSADHGESLGRDGTVGHGTSLSEDFLHVPLILYSEARKAAWGGRRIGALAEEVDIAPTVLDLCGLSSQADAREGRSLLDLITTAPAAGEKLAYAEFVDDKTGRFFASVRSRDFRLVWNAAEDAFSLFDLRGDPSGLRDAALDNSLIADAMKKAWLDRLGIREFREYPLPVSKPSEPKMLEKLKALGYIKRP